MIGQMVYNGMIGKGFIQGMIYVFRVLIGLGFWWELDCFTQGMIGHI